MELDIEITMPQKDPTIPLESHTQSGSHKAVFSIFSPKH